MAQQTAALDSNPMRERLMAADPMPRAAALHALECELARQAHLRGTRIAQAIEAFVARGMPFYSHVDPHYLAWVEQAVQYWDSLQRKPAATPAKAAPAPKPAVARRARLELADAQA